ncbi:hypothetical protein BO70DRAFT_352797 [Aspergillus heteromorphus CBS 117.55]|uniref:DUF7704 domain-containing protein n=1 Tax=Aspergillus heteromorphus CBS 117.55 TaxID=1448321 RepID=A0A317W6F0_9EURO|nr:uncharacterized protein BO70DRAFT_352797 [Aspergillus heteromorphus CBS 117.55]PWY82196.1 hypothetical protein BO70DRAFT_352797 [Aspergillus heteromorphus CBS 117.55]
MPDAVMSFPPPLSLLLISLALILAYTIPTMPSKSHPPIHPPILPPIPYLIFGIIEPISLIAGTIYPHLLPADFITSQIPSNPTATITPSALSLAYQVSNLYALLALLGLAVLHSTTEPRVVRNYLLALAVADLGHVWAVGRGMGLQRFVDVAGWNALTWGNVGVTMALFGGRVVVLLGGWGGCSVEKGKKE